MKGDEIRRVVVETVIPLSKQFLVGRVEKKLGKAGNVPDTLLAEYDEFDDYLEMVIQFGVSIYMYIILLRGLHTILKCFLIFLTHSTSHCLPLLSLWEQQ